MFEKQKIMTIDAKELFYYFEKKPDEQDKPFCFNTTKRTWYKLVVKQEIMMEECPLFHQFFEVIKEKSDGKIEINDSILYEKFVIVDFGDLFLPEDKKSIDVNVMPKEKMQRNAQDIIKNGLILHFQDKDVHLLPFDKSGNMSRNARLTFVDKEYIEPLNIRLNLEMDFKRIPVYLSKYYAYRGLYLSSSRRVQHKYFKISPETFVIIKDQRMKKQPNTRGPYKGEFSPVLGVAYERDVMIETAEEGKIKGQWIFGEPKEKKLEYQDMPYDGEGIILPSYAEYINENLQLEGASSYQIRMPFVKGMVHKVDVLKFLDEFSTEEKGEEPYWYEDAFGIKRDLKKAGLLVTESMFKGKEWLLKHCENEGIEGDPMEYYCGMLKTFHHALYVSGTNLPYGHSQYTHLSYQAINTLAFSKEQFENVVKEHTAFIQEPLNFLKGWEEPENTGSGEQENDLSYFVPNWKRAVLTNEDWKNDIYIKGQLKNIQNGLLTKLVNGKILVEGQTRYFCRDLLPLLASLLSDEKKIRSFYKKCLWQRFYMPFGEDEFKPENQKLDYRKYYAFFRNPHLSRNEQSIMQPFVSTKNYSAIGRVGFERFEYHLDIYHRYFSHLTGVVMVPRGSIVPLCLGGADFDGDLVSIIFNQDVVDAVKKGAYEQKKTYWKRRISVVKIPASKGEKEIPPSSVPYSHIYNTFYNRIGQISNAAISIGQTEYGSQATDKEGFDADKATCARCTLLTGLEIDAAKNGIHPNLDIILNDEENRTCEYLRFLNKFKKLRSEKQFRMEKIKVEKSTVLSKEQIEVSAADCKTVAKFKIQDSGTYINQLPILFFDHNKQKAQKEANQMTIDVDRYMDKQSKREIEQFQKECQEVFELYFFFKNIFLKKLTQEKSRGFYAHENIETLIDQMYDKSAAEKIQRFTMPVLQKKIEDAIGIDADFEAMQERINTYQWQFQPSDRRLGTLEKIIGNDFQARILTEDEKKVLCHFNQQGYKLLFFILAAIAGPRCAAFEKIKSDMEEKRKKYVKEDVKDFADRLEKELRQYYDNNTENIGHTLYVLCLDKVKEIIERFDTLDELTIIAALYKATEHKTNSDNRKFFWDAFSWDQLIQFVKEG